MAEKKVIKGIDEIQMGDPGADGAMGSSLSKVGDLVPDSVTLTLEQGGSTELYVEDADSPFLVIPDKRIPKTLEFQSRRISINELQRYFGGTISDSDSDSTDDTFELPVTYDRKQKSIKLLTQSVDGRSWEINIPLAVIRPSLNGQLLDTDTAIISVTADIEAPYDTSNEKYVSPIKFTDKSLLGS